MALAKSEVESIINKFGRDAKDSGATEVQIALFTADIEKLISHLKANPKDKHTQRGLLRKVKNREKFLNYLFKTNRDSYKNLVKALNIRDKRKVA